MKKMADKRDAKITNAVHIFVFGLLSTQSLALTGRCSHLYPNLEYLSLFAFHYSHINDLSSIVVLSPKLSVFQTICHSTLDLLTKMSHCHVSLKVLVALQISNGILDVLTAKTLGTR